VGEAMSFLNLRSPSEGHDFGALIASIYHHSQTPDVEAFQKHCIRVLKIWFALDDFHWFIASDEEGDKYFLPRVTVGDNEDLNNALSALCTEQTVVKENQLCCFELESEAGTHHACVLSLPQDNTGLIHRFGLIKADGSGSFGEKQKHQISLLLPHLSEAYRLQTIYRLRHQARCQQGGYALCDIHGHFLECSAQFDKLVGDSDDARRSCLGHLLRQTAPVCWHREDALLIRGERVLDHYHIQAMVIPQTLELLTQKQLEVCFYLHQALENGDIADKMAISRRTVENHLINIYQKTGLKRSELFVVLNRASAA
jgi:DNA-binding CsgD family transcriptional regulator